MEYWRENVMCKFEWWLLHHSMVRWLTVAKSNFRAEKTGHSISLPRKLTLKLPMNNRWKIDSQLTSKWQRVIWIHVTLNLNKNAENIPNIYWPRATILNDKFPKININLMIRTKHSFHSIVSQWSQSKGCKHSNKRNLTMIYNTWHLFLFSVYHRVYDVTVGLFNI